MYLTYQETSEHLRIHATSLPLDCIDALILVNMVFMKKLPSLQLLLQAICTPAHVSSRTYPVQTHFEQNCLHYVVETCTIYMHTIYMRTWSRFVGNCFHCSAVIALLHLPFCTLHAHKSSSHCCFCHHDLLPPLHLCHQFHLITLLD